ncbi:unnamed protein product [Chrysoparadoxa australica]
MYSRLPTVLRQARTLHKRGRGAAGALLTIAAVAGVGYAACSPRQGSQNRGGIIPEVSIPWSILPAVQAKGDALEAEEENKTAEAGVEGAKVEDAGSSVLEVAGSGKAGGDAAVDREASEQTEGEEEEYLEPYPPELFEVAEDEEMEETSCAFCNFMRESPCSRTFRGWEKCLKISNERDDNLVQRCRIATMYLTACMSEHPEYFQEEDQEGGSEGRDVAGGGEVNEVMVQAEGGEAGTEIASGAPGASPQLGQPHLLASSSARDGGMKDMST